MMEPVIETSHGANLRKRSHSKSPDLIMGAVWVIRSLAIQSVALAESLLCDPGHRDHLFSLRLRRPQGPIPHVTLQARDVIPWR